MVAPVAFGAAWVAGRLFNVLDARDGVLSSYARVRDHSPLLKRALLGATAASAFAVAGGLTGILDDVLFRGASVTAGVAGLLGFLATRWGTRRVGSRRQLSSPEGGQGMQLVRTWVRSGVTVVKPEDQLKGVRGVAAALMLLMMVPLELSGLNDISVGGKNQLPTLVEPQVVPPPPVPNVTAGTVAGTSLISRQVLVAGAEGVGLLGLGAAGTALVRRRRRRLELDGAQILAELDLARFRQLAERSSVGPMTPHTAMLTQLSSLRAPDAFSQQALRRAVDLASQLPKETVLALSDAVESLCTGRTVKEEEASLLARCIQETDPDLATRFRFLALEGQLEAQAAETWFKKAGRGG
jgi:hypothetical protein